MSESFLSSFSKLPKTAQSFSSAPPQYSNTLPSSQCPNGFPVDTYAGYGVNSWEVLYSIWNSYQSTIGAKFTQSQSDNLSPFAPNQIVSSIVGPKNIFIIRHGEKNKSVITTTSANIQYHINQNGVYRACQIPTLVNKLATTGFPITYMVSTNPCPFNSDDPSTRNQQTINMASFLLNIPLFVFGDITQTQAVANALFDLSPTNPFNGLNILICWEHTTIQDLCLKLMDKANNVNRSLHNGEDFFAQPSVSNQTCVDGQYLAPNTSTAYPFNIQTETSPGPPPTYTYTSHPPATAVYPFWNTNNFDNMFCFKSNLDSSDFIFTLSNQQQYNCLTCYPNCETKIGLFQPPSSCTKAVYYTPGSTPSLEQECLTPPTDWTYTPP